MLITRTSPVTGIQKTREINVTIEQLKAWESGQLIQDAMPNLTADEREFIISGCTPDDFETLFPEE